MFALKPFAGFVLKQCDLFIELRRCGCGESNALKVTYLDGIISYQKLYIPKPSAFLFAWKTWVVFVVVDYDHRITTWSRFAQGGLMNLRQLRQLLIVRRLPLRRNAAQHADVKARSGSDRVPSV